MTYLLAAAVASGVFIVAGWRSRRAVRVAAIKRHGSLPATPLWHQPEIDLSASQAQADVGAAIRLAMKRLAPVMANQSVQAEVATPPGLLVRMRPPTLVDLLEELLTAAIHAAPASRLLVTAALRGDRIYVSVTDDMLGANQAVRLGSVRGLIERVAMRGGALDLDVRPNEGTSLTFRFAAVTPDRQDKNQLGPPEIVKATPVQSVSMSARD